MTDPAMDSHPRSMRAALIEVLGSPDDPKNLSKWSRYWHEPMLHAEVHLTAQWMLRGCSLQDARLKARSAVY